MKSQTRRRFLAAVGATATAVTLPSTVSAQTSSTQGLLADGFDEPAFDVWAFLSGFRSRYEYRSSPPEAVTLADRARNEFNANTDAWVSYGNWLLEEADVTAYGSATVGVDIVLTRRRRLRTEPDTASTTIDVTYDDGTETFTDLEWRSDEPEDPDFQIELQDMAAEDAADELQEFRREWIDDGHEIPDDEYLNELAGRYSGSLRYGSDSRHVLELLLGGDY